MPRSGEKCAAPASFLRFFPARRTLFAQGFVEPGPGVGPVTVGGSPRQPQGGGGLVQRQTGEEAQGDPLGGPSVALLDGGEDAGDLAHAAEVNRPRAVQQARERTVISGGPSSGRGSSTPRRPTSQTVRAYRRVGPNDWMLMVKRLPLL